jgi:hypothetical protein
VVRVVCAQSAYRQLQEVDSPFTRIFNTLGVLESMASSKFRTSIMLSVVLLLSISSIISATGNAATGSITITIQGYSITGTLTDLTGHQSDVKLLMSIDQTIPISMGTVHIIGSGIWTGTLTDTMITGSIDQVTGKVHACALLSCQDANFTGSGTWAGNVEALASGLPEGSGTFQATLNFQSPNPPTEVPVSGNWTCILNI